MDQPQPLSSLAALLGLGPHEHVAIVGGGGKTTLMHALADQLAGSVVISCTTKMGHDQHRGRAVLLSPTTAEVVALCADAPVMVWEGIDGHKAIGVRPECCDEYFGAVDHVVVEADGSRGRPFKAPADHEPVVPLTTTVMVSVIGADALGRVIADQCHRPLRVAALAECTPYERLSSRAAAAVLLHERGALKALPAEARLAVVVTKVDERSAVYVEALVADLADRSPSTQVIQLRFDAS